MTKKVSFNPFRMLGTYVGVVIGLFFGLMIAGLSSAFGGSGSSSWGFLVGLSILGFLVGWGLHSLLLLITKSVKVANWIIVILVLVTVFLNFGTDAFVFNRTNSLGVECWGYDSGTDFVWIDAWGGTECEVYIDADDGNLLFLPKYEKIDLGIGEYCFFYDDIYFYDISTSVFPSRSGGFTYFTPDNFCNPIASLESFENSDGLVYLVPVSVINGDEVYELLSANDGESFWRFNNGFVAEYAPECSSHLSLGCVENSVYWFDSCGEREDLVESCGFGEECVGDACVVPCVSQHHKLCVDDSVFWFDSCGVIEDLVESCSLGCLDGECVVEPVPEPWDWFGVSMIIVYILAGFIVFVIFYTINKLR